MRFGREGLQLEVDDIVFNGLAASLALLSNEQKNWLAGDRYRRGTTEYVVYMNGIIKHTACSRWRRSCLERSGVRPSGPMSRAEQLKLEQGSAILDDESKGKTVALTNELGLPTKTVNLEHLRRIMSLRLEEIFQLNRLRPRAGGSRELFAAGFFCAAAGRGSGDREARGAGAADAGDHWKTNSISGLKSALDQPEFATAIGR